MKNENDIENAIKNIASTYVANLNSDQNTSIELIFNLSIVLPNNN